MKKLSVGIGGLLILSGVTFGLQGLGMIGGSAMSGKTAWAVIGPLIALVGVALVAIGFRGSSTVSSDAATRPPSGGSSGSDGGGH